MEGWATAHDSFQRTVCSRALWCMCMFFLAQVTFSQPFFPSNTFFFFPLAHSG